jgi:hypothetical protein
MPVPRILQRSAGEPSHLRFAPVAATRLVLIIDDGLLMIVGHWLPPGDFLISIYYLLLGWEGSLQRGG